MNSKISLYLIFLTILILFIIIFFCQRKTNLENFTTYNWKAGPWSECYEYNWKTGDWSQCQSGITTSSTVMPTTELPTTTAMPTTPLAPTTTTLAPTTTTLAPTTTTLAPTTTTLAPPTTTMMPPTRPELIYMNCDSQEPSCCGRNVKVNVSYNNY